MTASTMLYSDPNTSDRDVIELDGTIIDGAHGIFKVRCELEGRPHFVLASISGKLRMSRIAVMTGDRVRVELGSYDLTRGRITWRHK